MRIITLALLLAFAAPAVSSAKIVDKIVAVVNSEIITQAEIERLLYPLYKEYKEIYHNEQELYRMLDEVRIDILKQLVNDRLILSEAKRLQIEVTSDEVDAELKKVEEELAAKGVTLDGLLFEQNLTITDLRDKYEEQLMIKKAVESQVGPGITIQPSEIDKYYYDNIGDYTQPEQVAALSIMIKLESERTLLESRQLVDDIRVMLINGADFRRTARNYSEGPESSDGGDIGYVARGQLLREIDDAIFDLKVGEISEVIETPIGYHLFKVYDKKKEEVLSLEKLRPKLRDALYRKKLQTAYEEWLENLRSNAYISIK